MAQLLAGNGNGLVQLGLQGFARWQQGEVVGHADVALARCWRTWASRGLGTPASTDSMEGCERFDMVYFCPMYQGMAWAMPARRSNWGA